MPNLTYGLDFLRWEHEALASNAANTEILEYQSAHLSFVRGDGVRSRDRRICRYCNMLGWDDGEWHPIGD